MKILLADSVYIIMRMIQRMQEMYVSQGDWCVQHSTWMHHVPRENAGVEGEE